MTQGDVMPFLMGNPAASESVRATKSLLEHPFLQDLRGVRRALFANDQLGAAGHVHVVCLLLGANGHGVRTALDGKGARSGAEEQLAIQVDTLSRSRAANGEP
jgi:hypothetical protein